MKVLAKIAIAASIAALAACSGNGDPGKASGNFANDPTIPPEPAGSDESGLGNQSSICNIEGSDFTVCISGSAEVINKYEAFCSENDGVITTGSCETGKKTCEVEGLTVELSGEAAEEDCKEIKEIFKYFTSDDEDKDEDEDESDDSDLSDAMYQACLSTGLSPEQCKNLKF